MRIKIEITLQFHVQVSCVRKSLLLLINVEYVVGQSNLMILWSEISQNRWNFFFHSRKKEIQINFLAVFDRLLWWIPNLSKIP